MKNENNISQEDFFNILINSSQEQTELLKEIRSILSSSNHQQYMDSADTKQKLNVSDSTLYRWRKEGLIIHRINKGKIYYDIFSVLGRK